MKHVIFVCLMLAFFFGLTGCGNESVSNEAIGQIKKVVNQTPLICSDRVDVDMSLGVVRNGTGSMSTQDIWYTLAPNFTQLKEFKEANEKGQIVKIHYDVRRLTFCPNDHQITSFEVVQ